MSVEGHDSADGHVDAVPDFLQPIRKEESTVGGLDIKDASERRPSDQKHVGQGDTSTGGAKSAVADEVEGGKILGSVFENKTNKEQQERPCEPVASPLDVDKENTVQPNSARAHVDIPSSLEQVAEAPHENVVPRVAEDPLHESLAPEIKPVQEATESIAHKDNDISTAEPVPKAEGPITSLPQDAAPEEHPPVSDLQISAPLTANAVDSMPGVAEVDYETVTISPEVEKTLPIVEPTAVEAESAHTQIPDAPAHEEQAEANPADISEYNEGEIPVQLAVATESKTQVDMKSSLSATIENQMLPIESVDMTAPAATLVTDEEGPTNAEPQVYTAPAETQVAENPIEAEGLGKADTAPSVEAKINGASVDRDERHPSAVDFESSTTAVDRDIPPTNTLSICKDDDEGRPRSPWTPSYSVTTQGPGEPAIAEPVMEPEVQEDVTPSVKEPVPEFVHNLIDPTEAHVEHENVPPPAKESTPQMTQAPKNTVEADVKLEVSPSTETETKGALLDSDAASLAHPVVVPSTVSPAHIDREITPTDSLSVGKGEDVERPRSPWTPSYSVATQGAGESDVVETNVEPTAQEDVSPAVTSTPEADAAEPDVEPKAHEDVPPLAVESARETAKSPVERDRSGEAGIVPEVEPSAETESKGVSIDCEVASSETYATAVHSEVSPAGVEHKITDIDSPSVGKGEDVEHPRSPWTPSYSVITQGPGESDVVETPGTREDVPTKTSAPEVDVAEPDAEPEAHGEVPSSEMGSACDMSQTVESPVEPDRSGEAGTTPSEIEPSAETETKGILVDSQVASFEAHPVAVHSEVSPANVEREITNIDCLSVGKGDVDRPRSPWTPSYSVTNHGPGDSDAETIVEPKTREHVATTSTPDKAEPNVEPEAHEYIPPDRPGETEATPEVEPSPETETKGVPVDSEVVSLEEHSPSEVSPAGAPNKAEPDVGPEAHEYIPPDRSGETEAAPEAEPSPETETKGVPVDSEVVSPEELPPSEVSPAGVGQGTTNIGSLSVDKGEDVKRPRSPWTPSYSVTSQGLGESNIVEPIMEPEVQEDVPSPAMAPAVDAAEPDVEPGADDGVPPPIKASTPETTQGVKSPVEPVTSQGLEESNVVETIMEPEVQEDVHSPAIASVAKVDAAEPHVEPGSDDGVPPIKESTQTTQGVKSPVEPVTSHGLGESNVAQTITAETIMEPEVQEDVPSPAIASGPKFDAADPDVEPGADDGAPPIKEYTPETTQGVKSPVEPVASLGLGESNIAETTMEPEVQEEVPSPAIASAPKVDAADPDAEPGADGGAPPPMKESTPETTQGVKSPVEPVDSLGLGESNIAETTMEPEVQEDVSSPAIASGPKVDAAELDVEPGADGVPPPIKESTPETTQGVKSPVESFGFAEAKATPEAMPSTETKTKGSLDVAPPETYSIAPVDTLSVDGGDIERPRSPWTPSYSVTTQGPQESDMVETTVKPEVQEDIAPAVKESTPGIVVDRIDAALDVKPELDENVPLAKESMTEVVIDRVDAAEPDVEYQAHQNVPHPTKESTSEIASGPLDAAETVEDSDTNPATEIPSGVVQEREVNLQSEQEESIGEERRPSKPSSLLGVDASSLSLGSDEAKGDDTPKSPWTPSYSVTTQGPTHELEELDQLLPRANESVARHASDAFDGIGTVEHSEPAAPGVLVDIDDRNGQVQPPDVPAIAPHARQELGSASVDAVVSQQEKPVAVSISSEGVITSQVTLDPLFSTLDDEGDTKPKSAWIRSYSMASQGSASASAMEEIQQLATSGIELADQPGIDGTVLTTEELIRSPSVPEAVTQGDQNEPETIHDQPVFVPSIDIMESQGLPQITSVNEGTVSEQANDIVIPGANSFIDEVTTKSPSHLVVNTSPNLAEDEDRPKSPWTPSYSVSNQGNTTQDSADFDQLEQLTPDIIGSKEAPESPAVGAAGGRSLNIHSIPSLHEVGPDSQTPQLLHVEATVEPTSYEAPVAKEAISEGQVATDVGPEVTKSGPGEPNASLAIPEGNPVEDRPASPWTPSYSVISQGPGRLDAQWNGLHNEDLDQLKQASEHPGSQEAVPTAILEDADDMSVSSNVPEPPRTPQSELGIFTPGFDTRSEVSAASREPASPTSSRTDLTPIGDQVEESVVPTITNILALPALALDHDDSTPQLTPLAIVKDVQDTGTEECVVRDSAPVQKVESVSEDISSPSVTQKLSNSSDLLVGEPSRTIQEKPSLLRLTFPEEDGSSDRPLLSFEMPSSATSRKRLESTTSSRFFPGGWFSPSPTVPEESRTRTSLDVASGEFIRSPSTESRPSGESPASDSVSVPSAIDQDDKEKPRWCTIM